MAVRCQLAFRVDQRTISRLDQLSGVAQRVTDLAEVLRQRIGIRQPAAEVVERSQPNPAAQLGCLSGRKEVLLTHRRCQPPLLFGRQRRSQRDGVEMRRVVCREDHWWHRALQVSKSPRPTAGCSDGTAEETGLAASHRASRRRAGSRPSGEEARVAVAARSIAWAPGESPLRPSAGLSICPATHARTCPRVESAEKAVSSNSIP